MSLSSTFQQSFTVLKRVILADSIMSDSESSPARPLRFISFFDVSILCNSQTTAIERHIGVSHARNTDTTPAYYACSAAFNV
jgi:hypothetical protein